MQTCRATSRNKIEFFTERFIDAVAPTNFALTNPEVLRKTVETGGANLAKGFSRFLDDLAADAGHVRRAAEDAFELGVNLATSKRQRRSSNRHDGAHPIRSKH